MIDHISIAVRDIKAAEAFYSALLAPLGLNKLREWPDAAIGYGKKYPEFWINRRTAMVQVASDSGVHICLRAASTEISRCLSRRRACRGRFVRRRAGPSPRIPRPLLRGLHPRSRWQSP